MISIRPHTRIATVFLTLIFFSQLSCTPKSTVLKPAVTINAYKLSAEQFEELYREYGSGDDTSKSRMEFLDNLITRKLLLQEAQRLGLDTQKEFLRSIENFWEKSLLTLVVEHKMKEAKMAAGSTKEGSAGDAAAWRARKQNESRLMDEWTQDLIRKANIQIDKKSLRIE